jgi:toxin-antitoxin system PIN domain toxin
MTSYFPDVNIWLALNDEEHAHAACAWNWLRSVSPTSRLNFSRYTQMALLRLLTTNAVMGERFLTLGAAWQVFDRWATDSRVVLLPEPESLDSTFRTVTEPFLQHAAAKTVGDCYLLAFAIETNSTLVTFDRKPHALAKRQGCPAVIPS